MKIKYKKELKYSDDLEVGDSLKIGDLMCTVKKVEDIFHHAPATRVRLELTIEGATSSRENAVLFLPQGLPIETLK